MLLYAFGFLMNGISCVYFPDPDKNFFSGFNQYRTYLELLCQSLFGVTIGAVYKFSDVTTKTFALSCATNILIFINVVAFDSAFSLKAHTCFWNAQIMHDVFLTGAKKLVNDEKGGGNTGLYWRVPPIKTSRAKGGYKCPCP